MSVINDAIKEGRLCNYTAMTDSGRGIGLLFLYDRSIAAHGNTERQIKFHKSLYNKMIKLIEKLLNEYNGVMLSVDKGVRMLLVCADSREHTITMRVHTEEI